MFVFLEIYEVDPHKLQNNGVCVRAGRWGW